ncbi:hypothetical protein MNBD_CHLOROFLEXI01-2727 [hydrothermal vent metagenome]|uniref:Uncharacterized protein n=1 Tax=hydrothermal vent metagenome TaxID=652676 RepID=A0A3B0VIS9_9ZZZZ
MNNFLGRGQLSVHLDTVVWPHPKARTLAGSRREALKQVTMPTLVIHGEDDPLVRVEGGRDTVALEVELLRWMRVIDSAVFL